MKLPRLVVPILVMGYLSPVCGQDVPTFPSQSPSAPTTTAPTNAPTSTPSQDDTLVPLTAEPTATPTASPIAISTTVPTEAPTATQPLGSISGFVLEDVDNDDEGEEPLAGVLIVLVSLTDSSGDVFALSLSEVDGSYLFSDLPLGSYLVIEENPVGYEDVEGELPDGVPVTLLPDDNMITDVEFVDRVVAVEESGSLEGYALYQSTTPTVDGGQEEVLVPVPGVTVILCDAAGNEVARGVTDENGRVRFRNLPPGRYTVKIQLTIFQGVSLDGAETTALVTDEEEATPVFVELKETVPPEPTFPRHCLRGPRGTPEVDCPKPSQISNLTEFVSLAMSTYETIFEVSWDTLTEEEKGSYAGLRTIYQAALANASLALEDAMVVISPEDAESFMSGVTDGMFLLELDAYEASLNSLTLSNDQKEDLSEVLEESLEKLIQFLKDKILENIKIPSWVRKIPGFPSINTDKLKKIICTAIEVLKEILKAIGILKGSKKK